MSTLTHPDYWRRMDEVARMVDGWPDWLKGSPTNEREAVLQPEPMEEETLP